MNVEDINKVIQDLSKMKQRPREEAEDYLRAEGLLNNDEALQQICLELVDQDIFSWLDFLCEAVKRLVSLDDGYFRLISKITDRIYNDMAQAAFLEALISIGENNKALAPELVEKILNGSGPVVNYAGFVLGGLGRREPDAAWKLILSLQTSSSSMRRFTSIRAIRVMFETAGFEDRHTVFDILASSASEGEDIEIRNEVLQAFIDFYRLDPKICKKGILDFSTKGTSFRLIIGSRLSGLRFPDRRDNLEVLKACAEDTNPTVRESVSFALANIVEEFPEEVLEIVRSWFEGSPQTLGQWEYLMQRLGASRLDRALAVIEKWAGEEDNTRILGYVPMMVNRIAPKGTRQKLGPYLKKWVEMGGLYSDVSVDIIHEILSNAYPGKDESEFVHVSLELLSQIATMKGLSSNTIIADENDHILQAAKLIEAIRRPAVPLDYEFVQSNLRYFPNIKNLMGQRWFDERRAENDMTHTLLRVLSRRIPGPSEAERLVGRADEVLVSAESGQAGLFDYLFLKRLDTKIKVLQDSGVSMRHFKDGLSHDPGFSATISEIEFVVSFEGRVNIVVEPEIRGKKLDARIDISGRQIYVEVISPDTFKPLRLLSGVREIKNQAKSKVFDEFQSQLSVLEGINQPALVAIDIGRSEIDYDFVEDYLFGTLKVNFAVDSLSHRLAGTSLSRERDSMHDLNPPMDIISGIICFRVASYNPTAKLSGKIIHNPYARFPLEDSVFGALDEILFG